MVTEQREPSKEKSKSGGGGGLFGAGFSSMPPEFASIIGGVIAFIALVFSGLILTYYFLKSLCHDVCLVFSRHGNQILNSPQLYSILGAIAITAFLASNPIGWSTAVVVGVAAAAMLAYIGISNKFKPTESTPPTELPSSPSPSTGLKF